MPGLDHNGQHHHAQPNLLAKAKPRCRFLSLCPKILFTLRTINSLKPYLHLLITAIYNRNHITINHSDNFPMECICLNKAGKQNYIDAL